MKGHVLSRQGQARPLQRVCRSTKSNWSTFTGKWQISRFRAANQGPLSKPAGVGEVSVRVNNGYLYSRSRSQVSVLCRLS